MLCTWLLKENICVKKKCCQVCFFFFLNALKVLALLLPSLLDSLVILHTSTDTLFGCKTLFISWHKNHTRPFATFEYSRPQFTLKLMCDDALVRKDMSEPSRLEVKLPSKNVKLSTTVCYLFWNQNAQFSKVWKAALECCKFCVWLRWVLNDGKLQQYGRRAACGPVSSKSDWSEATSQWDDKARSQQQPAPTSPWARSSQEDDVPVHGPGRGVVH